VSSLSGSLRFRRITNGSNSAWTVIGRNNLRRSGTDAHLGVYAYGFTWASVAAFFLSMIMFCIAGAVSKRKDKNKTSRTSSTTPVVRTSRFGRSRAANKPIVVSEVENGGIKSEYV